MSNKIQEILDDKGIVVLDGGLGAELKRRGIDVSGELWSAVALSEAPELIEQLHYEYFSAGANVGISASYQASIEGFKRQGCTAEQAEALIRRSAELVVKARARWWSQLSDEQKKNTVYPVIVGSAGPYAASFADMSEYIGYAAGITRKDFIKYHRRRIELLIEGGAELIAIETTPSVEEAEAVLEILKDHPDIHAWVSFSSPYTNKISDGTPISEAVRRLEGYGQLAAIGINCVDPKLALPLIKEFKSHTSKPVIAYPNGKDKYDLSFGTKDFSENARIWYDNGAVIIGGCCLTTPDDIRNISNWATAI